MADPFRLKSLKKLHFFSAIPILFFFILILTLLLISVRSIPLLLSPSFLLAQFTLSKPAPGPPVSDVHRVQVDSEPITEKREMGSEIVGLGGNRTSSTQFPVSKRENNAPERNVSVDLESGDKNRGNGSGIVAISHGFGENRTRSSPSILGNETEDRNVPNSEGVSGQLGFVFEGRKGENGSRVFVSVKKNENMGFVNGTGGVKGKKGCNLYMGKWVRDDGYPVYKPSSCPFVDEAFDCQTNGRPDYGYLNWRWKPDDCHLPRFNATDFLDRIRGKRLMLVGDSVNRNQFESMICLLHQGLPDKTRMFEVHGYNITKGRGFYVFEFLDFNCTVGFMRSHFLVREGVRQKEKGKSNPTLSIDKIDKSAKKWKRADILIFNTAHWWTHGKTSRGKNYFKEGDYIYPQFDAVEAYRRAMKTWANWVDKNVNPARQLVFYRAYSSAHFRGGDWDSGGTCNGETEPILGGNFLDNYPTKMKIVEEVIRGMKVPVVLLNITRLTNFRKDGHPSIYGRLRSNQTKVSKRKQDCSHWCLPGVPDAWNELVYASLVSRQTDMGQL